MGSSPGIVFDLNFNDADASKNRSISELICYLKLAFLPRHYDEVESILVAREANLKKENQKLAEDYDVLLLEKLQAEYLLGEAKKECSELKESKRCMEEKYEKLVEELKNGEKNEKGVNAELKRKYIDLERAKKEVDSETEVYRGKFEELERQVFQLEGDILALANVNHHVSKEVGGDMEKRPSENGGCQNGNNVGVSNENLVEKMNLNVNNCKKDNAEFGEGKKEVIVIDCNKDNVVLASVGTSCHIGVKGNGCLQDEGSRGIVEISDSDDDCGIAKDLSGSKMTSQKLTASVHSGQKGVECETREHKRKRVSFPDLSESKNNHDKNNIGTNTHSSNCTMKQLRELSHKPNNSPTCPKKPNNSPTCPKRPNNSPANHCSAGFVSPVLLRQYTQKMGLYLNTQNRPSKVYAHAVNGNDNDDSSSSSDSEADTDSSGRFDFRDSRTWKSEVDLHCAFEQNHELCMKAVCALYRQRDTANGLPFSSNRGFNRFDATRETTLAEFLMDGDPQGNLKKSIEELSEFDPNGLFDCKKIAKQHSKQLFEIHQKKQDPLFPAC